jgi:hypothetical protein
MSRLLIVFSMAFLVLMLIAPMAFASTQKKSAARPHTQSARGRSHHNVRRLVLIPPPPPYVPSLLPELTYSRYYGRSPYNNSRAGNSPRLFKPNKYLTYCL